jgi:5-methylcytosine-specific restriction endonuclease McrA
MIPPPPDFSFTNKSIRPPPTPSPPPERIRVGSLVAVGGRRGAHKTKCCWCESRHDPILGLCKQCYAFFQRLLNDQRWRNYRIQYRLEHPLCDECKTALTTDVHHIKGWNFFPSLFWEPSNHQGLCAPCHYKHTRSDLTAAQRG